jgi:hypothetical protein
MERDMSSPAFRNNNPGNIRHHGPTGKVFPVVERWNGKDDGNNYAKFRSVADGCAALADLMATVYENLTYLIDEWFEEKIRKLGEKNGNGQGFKVP